MSPCCIAAATLTAVLTALVVAGLTAFVLVTDGFGLGLLAGTLLTAAFQYTALIGPSQRLLYALAGLLAARALHLLATSRRPLVIATARRAGRIGTDALGALSRARSVRTDLGHEPPTPAARAHCCGHYDAECE